MRSPLVVVALLCLCCGLFAAEADFESLVADLGSPDAAARESARAGLRAGDAAALQWLIRGLASPNLTEATACAEIIGASKLRGGREHLHRLVADKDTPDILKRACCLALGGVGDYRDVEPLIAVADRFPEAAEALVSLGEASALPELRRLASERSGSPSILYAVAMFGGDEGVPGLIALLGGEDDEEALHYLRLIAGRDAGSSAEAWDVWWRRNVLARRLGDPDWERSEIALEEILKTARPGGAFTEEVFTDLLAIAKDPGYARPARCKAILALGMAHERRCSGAVLDLLNNDEDGMVRAYAAEALGRIGDPALAVDLCAYLIFDEEPFREKSPKDASSTVYFTIDSEVCKSLVRLGVKGGLDFMIRQLGENHRVRVTHDAIRTLRRVTHQEHGFRPDGNRKDHAAAAARWRAWFDEERGTIRLPGPAAVAGGRLEERIEALVETLDHFHFLKMSRAKQTLVLLGETALPAVLRGLESPHVHVRVHCAEILAEIHAKKARGALARATRDDRPEVRAAAVSALGIIGPGGEAGSVIEAVCDPDLDVRIAAVAALARAAWWEAVPCVSLALWRKENQSDTFRREALFSLAAHGDAGAVDDLSDLLDHPDQAFRQLVADRLGQLTGKNPGVERAGIEEWRRWWKASREGYSSGGAVDTAR